MTINVLDLEDYVLKLERLQALNNILLSAGFSHAREGGLDADDIIGYSLAFSDLLNPIVDGIKKLVEKGCANNGK